MENRLYSILKTLSFTSSIDSDLVPRRRINQHVAEHPVPGGTEDENCNPLYESADQVDDYSSAVNSLYVSSDLQ
jgi:hypothetical protein